MHATLSISRSSRVHKSWLLQLPLVPCSPDLFSGDSPQLPRSCDLSRDSTRYDVDRQSDGSLLLVEVSDLIDLNFDNTDPGVLSGPIVDTVTFVTEPGFGVGGVEVLNKSSVCWSANRRESACLIRWLSETYLARPAMETQPLFRAVPSWQMLT
jgi:hypothetical protein